MNLFKRGIISIYRQPIKLSVFFLLVVILSILASGSILIRQAIINTEQNLRRRMPAVLTIAYDDERARLVYEQTGEFSLWEIAQPELIREIGAFPQVRMFDYAIDIREGVYSANLYPWYNPNFFTLPWEYHENLGVRLFIEGVNPTGFIELRESFMELTHGRVFEDLDLYFNESPYPVIISTGLADANELNVGSVFEMQAVVFNTTIAENEIIITHTYDPPLIYENFTLEIIGIFEPIAPTKPEGANLDDLFQDSAWQSRMQHRIFLPNFVAEMIFDIVSESPGESDNIFFQNFFVLNDPMDFEEFDLAVRNLSGFWRVADFSSGFRGISASMDSMQEIADLIFFMATSASFLITVLLVLLFLRDRKHEIGIYLALGEKKKRIVFQMILELIPLAVIGMTVALFIGNITAARLSREMLMQQMIQEQDTFLFLEDGNPLEFFGYRFELLLEEMIENFEIRFDMQSVVLFYSIGVSAFLIAIIIPIVYTIHTNPKELLT